MKHPTQELSDKIVVVNINKRGEKSAKIDYTKVLEVKAKNQKPLSNEFKDELNDLNGMFDGDNLDD